jgi:putative iron-regulated protein
MMNLRVAVWAVLACSCRLPLAGAVEDSLRDQAVLGYAELADRWYGECVAKAKELEAAVGRFLAAPDAAGLKKAREAWLAARIPYRKTEVTRFYAGPIDDDDGLEHLLNSWPVDEAYLEQVPGSPVPGIIENTKDYPKLTKQLLTRLNEREGEKNITCGWHVIEFLLWGQDTNAAGPGDRPVTDFTTQAFARRRGELLGLTTKMLLADLEYLAADWQPGKLGNYRAMWEEGLATSFGNALTGMTLLCEFELAGSRLQVPYDTQEQEEEHSCFSDSTHLDFQGNVQGLEEVWQVLRPAMQAKKAAEATAITQLIATAKQKAGAIPAPFDQAIRGEDTAPGRKAVKELILAVEDLGQALRRLGDALELEIPDSLEVVE